MSQPLSRRSFRGFSLIELMIAMAIATIIMAGVAVLFFSTNQSRSEMDKENRQIENGRYAMDVMAADVRRAGYFGELTVFPSAAPSGAAEDPCGDPTTANLNKLLAAPLAVYGGGATRPLTCIPANDYLANTDVLVIRRLQTQTTAAPSGNDVYMQTNSTSQILGLGSATFSLKKKDAVTTANIRKYITHIYFVSKCDVWGTGNTCDGAGADGIPTLKMIEYVAGASGPVFSNSATVPPLAIAEGIERLRFSIGIDTSTPLDGSPDSYVNCASAGCSLTQLYNAVTVRTSLLARNTEVSPSYTDTKTYQLDTSDSYLTAFNDGYKRHVFTSVFRSNNLSGRRE